MRGENYPDELALVRNNKLHLYFSYHRENEFCTYKKALMCWNSYHYECKNDLLF